MDVEESGGGRGMRDLRKAHAWEGMRGCLLGEQVCVDLLAEFEGQAEEGWLWCATRFTLRWCHWMWID